MPMTTDVMTKTFMFSFLRIFLAAMAVMMVVAVHGQEVKVSKHDYLNSLTGKQLIDLGLKYWHEKEMADSALLCFTLAANHRFNKALLNDRMEVAACADALNLMGLSYEKNFYHYQKANSCYLEAERFAMEHEYKNVLPNIYNNMAGLLAYKESINKRDTLNSVILLKYRDAFHEAWETKQLDVLGCIAINMSVRALDWNMMDSIRKELTLYTKENFKARFLNHNRSICNAVTACADGYQEEGLALLDKALGYSFGYNKKEKGCDSAMIYHVKSNILLRMGKNREALNQIDKVIELSERWNDYIDLCEVYDILSTFYRERNDEEKANHYELLYLRLKDRIMNKSKLEGLDKSQFLFEIDQLNKEAEEMAMRDRMKSRMLRIVSLFTILIICTLWLLYRKYKQVKENHRLLYQKSLEMIQTDEEKRQLIEKLEAQISQFAEQDKKEPTNEGFRMDEERMTDLLHRILMVMETSDEIYSVDFSLPRLAELVGDKRNNVSEAINQQYKTNFNTLLNEYRIKEACRRMNDREKFGNYTFEYFAKELGFNSRNTFTTAFKKVVGLTPSAYLKLAKQR